MWWYSTNKYLYGYFVLKLFQHSSNESLFFNATNISCRSLHFGLLILMQTFSFLKSFILTSSCDNISIYLPGFSAMNFLSLLLTVISFSFWPLFFSSNLAQLIGAFRIFRQFTSSVSIHMHFLLEMHFLFNLSSMIKWNQIKHPQNRF